MNHFVVDFPDLPPDHRTILHAADSGDSLASAMLWDLLSESWGDRTRAIEWAGALRLVCEAFDGLDRDNPLHRERFFRVVARWVFGFGADPVTMMVSAHPWFKGIEVDRRWLAWRDLWYRVDSDSPSLRVAIMIRPSHTAITRPPAISPPIPDRPARRRWLF